MSLLLLFHVSGAYVPPAVYGDPTFSRTVIAAPGRIGTTPDSAPDERIGDAVTSAPKRRNWGAS